jgi:hypothetical protein
MTKVFISYRRADSAATTGRIYDRLVKRFGRRNVFVDVDTIPAGTDFRHTLDALIDQCDAQLVVIGRSWLDIATNDGQRRLEAPDDVVRQEIEAGLERGVPIIPLLVDGADLPPAQHLPASIADLVEQPALEVYNTRDFDAHLQRVIDEIGRRTAAYHREQVRRLRLRGWRDELVLLRRALVRLGWAAVPVVSILLILLSLLSLTFAVLVYVRGIAPPAAEAVYTPTTHSGAMVLTSPRAGWAVGTKGRIWQLIQTAAQSQPHWRQVDSPVTTDLTAVAMGAADDGWAVGKAGVLLHYGVAPQPQLAAWIPVAGPTTHDLYGVAMVSVSDGWAVGAAGTILHDTNGTWSQVSAPARCDLYALALATPSSGWAVGRNGCLVRYRNGSWTAVSSSPALAPDAVLSAIALAPTGAGWAIGSSGGDATGNDLFIYFSAEQHAAGAAWQTSYQYSPGQPQSPHLLRSVALLPSGEAWAVGDGGLVAHYSGQQWAVTNDQTSGDLSGVALVSASEGWAIGADGQFLHLQQNVWTPGA